MRAIAVDRFGEDGSLHELPVPLPGPGEVLVRVTYAGANPADWKIRDGLRGERSFPLVLGSDFAGVVEATGERVFGLARKSGAFAERATVPAQGADAMLAPIPDRMSDAEAAALPIAGLTALGTLAALALAPGQTLLVVGGTGGVGAFAVQIAHGRGVRVIATAHSGKEDFARALGADEIVVYDREDVVAAVKANHPGGIDGALDVVSAPDALKRMAEIVRPGGRVVSIVRAADVAWFAERNVNASDYVLGASAAGLRELTALYEAGKLVVHLEAVRPLADAGEVLNALKAGRLSGKVVLEVSASA
jgi:NADPH:quinone reductase-like Zn-dependent oxidoreductase